MVSLDLFTAGIAASLAGSCGSCGSSSEPEAPKVGTAVVGQAKLTGGSTPSGLPSGGTAGQVLAKKSNSDYDVEWKNVGSNGGGALVVHMDEETGALDKTWAEINAAAPMVYYNLTSGSSNDFPTYNPLFACYESEGEYSVAFLNIALNTVDFLFFITDSANGHPVFD